VNPIARFLSRSFAESVSGEALGKEYLQTTMVLGAEVAVQKFTEAISEGKTADLSAVCTKPLFNRLESELDRLKARKETVKIAVPRAYDIRLPNILVAFGPTVNMATLKLNRRLRTWSFFESGATYFFLRWISIGFVVPKAEFLSSKQPTWEMVRKATEQGCVISVDCEIDADVEYEHRKVDGALLFEEKARRTILLQLTSRHMRLGEDMQSQASPAWKISDVDNLLQSSVVSDFLVFDLFLFTDFASFSIKASFANGSKNRAIEGNKCHEARRGEIRKILITTLCPPCTIECHPACLYPRLHRSRRDARLLFDLVLLDLKSN
jgi:hypothetical protein